MGLLSHPPGVNVLIDEDLVLLRQHYVFVDHFGAFPRQPTSDFVVACCLSRGITEPLLAAGRP